MKKLAGSPAAIPLLRNPAVLMKLLANVPHDGPLAARALTRVALAKLAELYLAGSLALAAGWPLINPSMIGNGAVPVLGPA